MLKNNKTSKSRLGTLLLHKRLISEKQLYKALSLQTTEQLKLGEILIQQGWVNPDELKKVLKKQSRYRLIATLGAVLLAPLQPLLVSNAAANVEPTSAVKMQPLSEAAMRDTVAQASISLASTDYAQQQAIDENLTTGEASLDEIITLLLPKADGLIDADISIEGVEYADAQTQTVNQDGSVNVRLPAKIQQISLKNIAFKGAQGKVLGDIQITNLSISPETTMRVSIHK